MEIEEYLCKLGNSKTIMIKTESLDASIAPYIDI